MQEIVVTTPIKAVPYYRVSTGKQGRSGLGLEAQKQKVSYCVNVKKLKVINEFTEVESGRKKNRPVLNQALQLCQKENAILLIADLSRLARSVLFIAQLEDAGIEFRSVDHFDAGKLIVHILASVDQDESERISARTIAALRVAKQKGVKLGTFGKLVLSKRNKRKAQDFAGSMIHVIEMLKIDGYNTVRAMRDELNRRGIAPYSGQLARWHTGTVFNLLKRIQTLNLQKLKI